MDLVILLLAGFAGGALNSLAGGGSFIVFPALLLAGVPPISANATNTFAALPGYVSGAAGYWRDVAGQKKRLLIYAGIALVGGYIGAEVLLMTSDEQFSALVPWLMAFAVTAFAFGGMLNRWLASRTGGHTRLRIAGLGLLGVLLLAICIYGGFFNAGLGIILLAYLALSGLTNVHQMNGLKLVISSSVSVIAVARFALNGSIDWGAGLIAVAGVVTGGYLAARLAHRIPAQAIRAFVIVYGVGLTAWFFVSGA